MALVMVLLALIIVLGCGALVCRSQAAGLGRTIHSVPENETAAAQRTARHLVH